MKSLFRINHMLVLSFVLLSTFGWAQSKKDSLLGVLHTSGFSDSLCNELIWAYVFNQPDSAIYFGKRGLEWTKANHVEKYIGTIFNRIGVAYDIKSMPDSALHWYNLALEQSRKRKKQKNRRWCT